MDARIKKLKADKERDPEGLIKNLMAITYSFPSFTIDYLYNQTMAHSLAPRTSRGRSVLSFAIASRSGGKYKKGK